MNTNETKKKDLTDDKFDIIIEKLNEILDKLSPVIVTDEGPKDPPPTPPNP